MDYEKLIVWQAERIRELEEELLKAKADLDMYQGMYWKTIRVEETPCTTMG